LTKDGPKALEILLIDQLKELVSLLYKALYNVFLLLVRGHTSQHGEQDAPQ
jgi:hypothetical protein